ncbi:MAG: DUF1036 domain-containing protein [Maricaulaceae bacterium]|jgi:uncharacterized membrane protein
MRRAAFAVLAPLLAAVLPAPAWAQWSICNETSYVIEVATSSPEAERQVTEGWTRVRPGDCEIARDELTSGLHHIYARSSAAHRGGLREWSGQTPLCVDTRDFSLAGDAACEDLGFETRYFLEEPIEGTEHTSTMVEPTLEKLHPDYGSRVLGDPLIPGDPERLRVAGIQRLLSDTGFYTRAIDGYPGRRTDQAISAFLSAAGLSNTPPDPELIDMLETAALQRSDEAGLKLCNRAEATVWTAVAMRAEESWESRGWWPLGPDECAKVLDTPLTQAAYYVYAAIEGEAGGEDRPLAAAQEAFCLAPTRFAILGRGDCEVRGFEEGRFLTVLSRERPAATLEFSESDFEDAGAALRR